MNDPHLENGDLIHVSVKKSALVRWAWLMGLLGVLTLGLYTALAATGQAETVQDITLSPIAPAVQPQPARTTHPAAVTAPISGAKGYLAHVTWFSSLDCKTTWCQANAGKPRGQQVAISPRFGHVSKVYVPVWNRTYTVIGSTDGKTDLDVWCEADAACQQSVGARTLLINLIP